MVKNPDDDARNLVGMFSGESRFYSYIDAQATTTNSLLRSTVAKTKAQPFVDPKLSFLDNYKRISSFLASKFQGYQTDLSCIPKGLAAACAGHPEIKDAIRNYPVWTILSDGMFNHMYSPEASMNDFFRQCEQFFGFRPYVILMDVTGADGPSAKAGAERFSGIDNMMYIPSNPAMIEQFLTNFKDMDVFDVYTPLLSMFRSSRYELVRKNTL
jgi:hypothetical protein